MKERTSNPVEVFRVLDTEIRAGRVHPVFLLYGEEEFFVRKSVDAIVAVLLDVSARAFNLDIMDGQDTDAATVLALVNAYPLMSERRIVVVYNIDRLADAARLSNYIAHPSPSTVLILSAEKPDFRRNPFLAMRKASSHVRLVEFRRLYVNEVPLWIVEYGKQLGLSLTSGAALRLQELVGDSPRDLASEIEKLSIFLGERRSASEVDIDEVIGLSRLYNSFELSRAIGVRDRRTAFIILERMLNSGEPPVKIVSILAKFYLTLLKIQDLLKQNYSDADIANRARIYPAAVREYRRYLQSFDTGAIQKGIRSLFEADLALKSSSADPRVVMTVLVHQLLR